MSILIKDMEMPKNCAECPSKTNADRIRSMTDEELARQIASFTGYEGNHEEVAFWLNWLKEKVKE